MFALAEQLGMPVALCGPMLMPVVARVAERHPGLKLVVDHFGLVAYTDDDDGGLVQSPDVLTWARYANVAVKLTGAPDYATEFTEHMPWLPDADLELIMGAAHCDWHGWAPRTRA